MDVLSNLDMHKNEVQNVVIQKLAAAPQNPVAGMVYYDTVLKQEMVYDGTGWIPGGSAVPVRSGTGTGAVVANDVSNNVASGNYSHAEGSYTTASGGYSHAEGTYTTASGYYSHAEGYRTIARGPYQHVSGRHNIEDTAGTYAEIIGNGTNSNARSNARTLDWNGNEVLAGKLTLGAAPSADMDAATKQYVDTGLNGKQDTLTAAQLAAVNSGITSQLVDNLYPTITNFDISGWTGEYISGFCTLIKINNVYYIKFSKLFYSSQIEAPHDYLIGSHSDLIGANVDVVVMVNDDANTSLKASRLYSGSNGDLYFRLVEKASYGITYCRCFSAIWIV